MTSSSVQSAVHSQFATAHRSFVQHNYPLSLTETLQALTQTPTGVFLDWLVKNIGHLHWSYHKQVTPSTRHPPSGITSAVKKNLMKPLITPMQQIYNILISLPIFPFVCEKSNLKFLTNGTFLIHIIKYRCTLVYNCYSPQKLLAKSLRLNAGRT